MTIKHSITLSTTEPNNEVGVIKIRQADEQTQTLEAQITENGVPKSYQGLTVYFCAKLGQTAGLGIIEQKLKSEEMTNPANGKLEYTMRAEDWQILGRQKGYFSFRKMKNEHEFFEQFTTRDFTFDVIKSVYSEGVKEARKDGSTYIWTIEEMIRYLQEFMDSGRTDFDEWYNEIKDNLSEDAAGNLMLLYQDLRDKTGKSTDFRGFENDKSFMERVRNEQQERGVNAKWFGAKGDGVTDDTYNLQTSMEWCAANNMSLYIPKGTYRLSKNESESILTMPNNLSVKCHDDAVFKLANTNSSSYSILDFRGKNNIKWTNGRIIGDTLENASMGEWGMGVHLANSSNIILKNLSSDYCFGDGFYIGGEGADNTSKNITLDGCAADGNRRQALSVINVDGLYIPNFFRGTNTKGTAPQACIDFEPNKNGEMLRNIRINDIISENNEGPAVLVALKALVESDSEVVNRYPFGDGKQIDIMINNVSSTDDFGGLSFYGSVDSRYALEGLINIKKTDIVTSKNTGIFQDQWKEIHFPEIILGEVSVYKSASYSLRQAVLKPEAASGSPVIYGNMTINNLHVMDRNASSIKVLLQAPDKNRRINSSINNLEIDAPTLYKIYIKGFVGKIVNRGTIKTDTILDVGRLAFAEIIWNTPSTIILPDSEDYVGISFTLIRPKSLDMTKYIVITAEGSDYIYSSSAGIAKETKKIIFDHKSKVIKVRCVEKGCWIVESSGYARELDNSPSNPIIYRSTKPSDLNFEVGTICMNALPREGTPVGWVLADFSGVKIWKNLSALT